MGYAFFVNLFKNKSKFGLIIYNTDDGKADVKLYSRDGVIRMSRQQMALLFDTSKQNISLHILNILQDKELYEKSVVKDYLTTDGDGKNYNITYYALPMVIAVGFRVRSLRRIYNARKRIPTKI